MKVLLIGATGIIGKIILSALRKNSKLDIITASRKGGTDLRVDISVPGQIREMYRKTGNIDSVISASGECWAGPFDEMTEEQMYIGIKSKMMGQINLVMIGKEHVKPGGSFTLTSGFISDDPVRGTINYSMANGAIDNFVFGAAIELKNGMRVNAVSPGLVVENYNGEMDGPAIGQYPVSHDRLAHAYYKSAFGYLTGQVFRVWEPSTQYIRK